MLNRKIVMALAAAMVLAGLYGCSSNSGIKNDRDEAIEARNAALAAQAQAEMERDAANTARAAAEAAQMAAETQRDAANTAQMMAEAAQATAEAAQMAAEEAETAAKAAQGLAEGERDAANTARDMAVAAAAAAEAAKMVAETERDAANTARDTAVAEATAAETRAMMAEAERDQAIADKEAAEAALALALATMQSNATYTAYTVAKAAFDTLLIAYGTQDTDVDDAEELVSKANEAMTAANAAAAAAANGTAVEMARAQVAVTAAQTAVAAANYELMQANTAKEAMPYAMRLGGDDGESMAPGYASAKHDGTNVKVTATRDDNATPTEATTDDTTIGKDVTATSVGNGWFKADIVKADDSNQTATVYTNIQDTMEKFTDVHTAADSAAISTVTNGVLTLVTTAEQLPLFRMLAASPSFPDMAAQTTTYIADDAVNPRAFAGMWDGVPGDFTCTGDTCSIAVVAGTDGADPTISAIEGEWTFTPDFLGPDNVSDPADNETAAATRTDDLAVPNVRVADEDYLRFGWWTTVNKDTGAVSFRTFYGGEEEYNNSGLSGLEGSATYKGPAAGRYAKKTYNANATLDSLEHGEFTASATLTARFGGGDIAANRAQQIDGTIDGFQDEDGNDMAGFSLTLGAIGIQNLSNMDMFTGDGQTDVNRDGGMGGSVGGSPVTTGDWEGQFFGNPAAGAAAQDMHPGSVAGRFDAHSSHGHVRGAFGATLDKRDK